MRVYEIAKELGISSKDILSMLKEKGIELPSHMSILSDQALDLIKKKYAKTPVVEKKAPLNPVEKAVLPKAAPPKPAEVKEVKKEVAIPQAPKKTEEKVFPKQPEKIHHHPPQQQQQQQPPPQRSPQQRQSFFEPEEPEAVEGIQGQDRISKILISKGLITKPPVKKPFGRRRRRGPKPQPIIVERAPVTEVVITKSLPLFEVAEFFGKAVSELILALLKKGMICNRNNVISVPVMQQLAEQFGIKATVQLVDQKKEMSVKSVASAQGVTRWPIAVVMGHVDHGKTTFLDYVRKMNVAGSEKGGITQHLGAYEVDSKHGKIVFLDTPGHEAFSYIRERGAKITDIAILMVAVDDGIKPQTIEAINQAKAAKVPIIVAVNKIDKMQTPAALETIKRQLAQHELMPEEWGGQTIMVPISAKTGQGVDKLLDMIVLQAQMMDLKADPAVPAKAFILESRLEKGFGPVATVICVEGTIKQGDFFTCGSATGKVRLLRNSRGEKIMQAGPSIPAQVIGFDNFAATGDWLNIVPMQTYLQAKAARPTTTQKASTTPDVMQSLATLTSTKKPGKFINLVIKTDTRGSKEAITDSIEKLVKAHKEIKCPINIILLGIGDVSESDIELAANTTSTIITLHVKVEKNAQIFAKQKDVDIQSFDIIYHMIDYLLVELKSKREVVITWKKVGEAVVKKVFDIKGVGVIAGCFMRDGILARNHKVACVRDGRVIGEAKISSLQRDKKSVKEVHAGYECGFMTDTFQDWAEGDTVLSYEEVREKPV